MSSKQILAHDLLRELLILSNRCMKIAQHFRLSKNFELLIQEKTELDDKNPRFVNDFKTFADVLIQQVTVYWLEKKVC